MKIYQQFAVHNDCYRRNQAELAKSPGSRDSRYARYYQGPRGVMVHSTGANNPNLRRYVQPNDGLLGENPNGNDWNRPGLEVAVHAFIGLTQTGEVAAYQILPWEFRAWHCGGDANDTHFSFEICEDSLGDRDYFERTYKAAVELTAELCRTFGLDPLAPGVVISHAEGAKLGIASNHADVGHWWSRYGATMDDFRRDVSKSLGVEKSPLYRVRRSWEDKESQIGAFADLEKAKAACPVGYSVYDNGGIAVYTNKEETTMTKEEIQKMVNYYVEEAVGCHYQKLKDVKEPSYMKELGILQACGVLKGRGGDGPDLILDMSEDSVRILVILTRILQAAGLLSEPSEVSRPEDIMKTVQDISEKSASAAVERHEQKMHSITRLNE